MAKDNSDGDPDFSERNVYKSSSRSDLVDNDQMSAGEAGFMEGYDAEEAEGSEDIDDPEEMKEYEDKLEEE